MSKLRDHIRDSAKRRSGAIGFAAARTAQRHPRQLLVIAEVADLTAAQAAIAHGLDALIYSGPPDSAAAIVAAAGSRPVGARADAATAQLSATLAAAGIDFLACVDETTDAAALLDPQLGYLLRIMDTADEDTLRLLRPLTLDAIIVPPPPDRMTLRDQLRLRRIADLARKPLIIRIEAAVPAHTLEVWRDAGAIAILTHATDPATLTALTAAADAVPPPRDPAERRDALVPSTQGTRYPEDDDESP